MTDIVERLTRDHADTTRQGLIDLCHEAADEIDLLRARVGSEPDGFSQPSPVQAELEEKWRENAEEAAMTDLTARMRTCAAALLAQDVEHKQRALEHAADLLIEAADALEKLTGPIPFDDEDQPIGEPMEIIPPVVGSDRSIGAWIAPGDTLPTDKWFDTGKKTSRACPKCDSRAGKTVRRKGNAIMLVCPVCAHEWPYVRNP